jgi:hypothetical protein
MSTPGGAGRSVRFAGGIRSGHSGLSALRLHFGDEERTPCRPAASAASSARSFVDVASATQINGSPSATLRSPKALEQRRVERGASVEAVEGDRGPRKASTSAGTPGFLPARRARLRRRMSYLVTGGAAAPPKAFAFSPSCASRRPSMQALQSSSVVIRNEHIGLRTRPARRRARCRPRAPNASARPR